MKSRILLAVARLLVALPLLSLDWPVAHADSTPLPAIVLPSAAAATPAR